MRLGLLRVRLAESGVVRPFHTELEYLNLWHFMTIGNNPFKPNYTNFKSGGQEFETQLNHQYFQRFIPFINNVIIIIVTDASFQHNCFQKIIVLYRVSIVLK